MWLPVAVWQVRLRTAGYTLYCMLYFNLLYITSHAAMGCTPMTLHAASRASVVLHLHLNRCVAKVVASRPVIGWRLHAPSNSTQIADGCGVGQLLCFRRMQAITANTVIAYITHNDRPNIPSASSRHRAKRRCGRSSLHYAAKYATQQKQEFVSKTPSKCCRMLELRFRAVKWRNRARDEMDCIYMWVKKTRHETVAHNFTKNWLILNFFSLLHSVRNLYQSHN